MNEVGSSFQAFQILKELENPFAEEIWVLALNAQLKVIRKEMVFRGTVDHCLIHPRDIFRVLIQNNASSFVLAHNHPSQEVLPSEQDLLITRKIHQLGKVSQIPLNDHLIFTREKYFSMADNGYFQKWKKTRSGLLNGSAT